MSIRNLTAEVQIYDAPAEANIFWHINMFCVHLKTNAQMPNPEQGKFLRRRLVMLWTSPEDLLARFSTQDETRVPHLVPESKTESHQWNHPTPRSPKKKL